MDNLVLAVFSDEFFEKCAELVKYEKYKDHGILFLRKTMKELGYDDCFISATIKKLNKKGMI